MKQRINVNDLMAQYAAELGEDLGDIDAEVNEENAFQDDPEMMRIQKQLNMVTMKNDQKIGKPATKVDELDQMLSQYENQPRAQKVDDLEYQRPSQQQAQKKQQGGGNDLTTIEKSISNPTDLQSLTLLKFEIGYLNQNVLPSMKKNKELYEFYRNQVMQLKEQQNSLIQKIKEEKIDASKYQKLVQQTFENEQKKFQVQKGAWKDRIGLRCKTLFQELDLLKKQQFEKIAADFGCAPDRTQQFLFEEFDQKPFLQKAQELLKRHKQWLNLTQYLSKNMKEERKEQIDELIKKLEISKGLQEQIKQGKNVSFSKFFLNEFQEITEEQFIGMNKIEFIAQIRAMTDQVNQAQKEENLYYKIASVAKPIIQQVPGSKQLVKVNPGDISKQYFARYEQILKYLEDLKKESWTPLPILKTDNEQRQISTDNRDVPQNTLRIQFKNLTQGGKLYLTYTIMLGNQQYQGKTEPADGDGKLNYVQDINLKDYKNCMKDLHLSKIDVKAFKKGFFSSDLKGETSISLSELLEMSTIENSTMLNGVALSYCIQMRESINKKKSVSVVTIVKTFPKINIEEGLDAYLELKMKEIPSQPVVEQKPQPQPQPQEQPQQVQQQEEAEEEDQAPKLTPDKLIAIIHQEDDEEFVRVKEYAEKTQQIKEEFLYPENPLNGSVFYFLVQYTDFIQKKSIEFKQIPQMKIQARFAQRLWEDCLRQKMKLQKSLQDDIEAYKTNLAKVIKKDQLFIKLYKQIKADTWAKFVEGRLEIALQEQQALSEM